MNVKSYDEEVAHEHCDSKCVTSSNSDMCLGLKKKCAKTEGRRWHTYASVYFRMDSNEYIFERGTVDFVT